MLTVTSTCNCRRLVLRLVLPVLRFAVAAGRLICYHCVIQGLKGEEGPIGLPVSSPVDCCDVYVCLPNSSDCCDYHRCLVFAPKPLHDPQLRRVSD